MRKGRGFFVFLVVVLFLPLVSASHFIVGVVNDAADGTGANGYEVVVWNPGNGIGDNVTDFVGPGGNSGADNLYFVDCELLSSSCVVDDILNVRVLNNGSDYVSETVSVTVTGAGFDVAPNLTLNSPPSVVLDSPLNFANVSSTGFDLSCTASDLDSNLDSLSLYGNWSDGWHANGTVSVSGGSEQVNFSTSLPEGIYEWSCLAMDNLSVSSFASENYTFSVDLTDPVISSVDLNLSGAVCGIAESVRVNCTATDGLTGVEEVLIEAVFPSGAVNYTAALLSGETYFYDVVLNETGLWSFSCVARDFANNTARLPSSENLSVHSAAADLFLTSSDIVFSNENPIESASVFVNATVYNNGCTDANGFAVGFFEGDPDLDGVQIGDNQTVSVLGLGNGTVNVTWLAQIGLTDVFVSLDLNDLISEGNETNNKANRTITVTAWQDIYGNVTIDKLLGDSGSRNLSLWFNETSLSGNIFITDSESSVDWRSLAAIGRNGSGDATGNDFSEIDSLFGMSSFSDSVSNFFTSDGNTPRQTDTFLVHQQNVSDVPVINSTNSSNFMTGILWDVSDDSNGEFDNTEREDLVFAAKVNKASLGAYGIYDYEITIPARLREYETVDTSDVFIYFDLN